MAFKLVDFKDRLKKIPPVSLAINSYRGFRKGNDPLSTANSLNSSGRWHIKRRFGAIYTAESEEICKEEILRQFEGVPPKYEYALVKLNIVLNKVLDLMDPKNLKLLNIEEDELTSGEGIDPDTVAIPNSIAISAHDIGYEAIIAPSATGLGKTIVIYPDNFINNTSIKVESEKKLF